MKNLITTHVLDTAIGKPAAKLPIKLFKLVESGWQLLATGVTDDDGRILHWGIDDSELPYGTYKLMFDLESYQGEGNFYPFAEIVFNRKDDRHHHIPLLLTPFGYSTYRGS